MDTNKKIKSVWIAVGLVILASLTRLIHHPFNFTAVGAMALFSGAVISDKRWAYMLPIAVLVLTDLILGFHASLLPVYGCFAFTVALGFNLRKSSAWYQVAGLSLISSIIFFLVTNLPFWYADLHLYPMTWEGTLQSYTMAVPFFRNQVAGDLFFNALLFGIYHLVAGEEKILVFNRTGLKK